CDLIVAIYCFCSEKPRLASFQWLEDPVGDCLIEIRGCYCLDNVPEQMEVRIAVVCPSGGRGANGLCIVRARSIGSVNVHARSRRCISLARTPPSGRFCSRKSGIPEVFASRSRTVMATLWS